MPERFSEFNIEKATEALGAEAQGTRDVAHGNGQVMNIGDTSVEVYQEAGVARVTTPDAKIELYRVPTYQVSPQRLVFQQGEKATRTRLLVRNDGRVWYYPGLRAPESARTAETVPSNEVVSPTPIEPSAATPDRSEGLPGGEPEHQEQEQQQLIGRLGRDPWFGIRGEEPAGGFPLAVNDEQGKATWHRVLVTGELVDQMRTGVQQGQIKRGRLVQVSGTEIVQAQQTPKGGTRTTTEFHATSVVRLKNAPAANPQAR